MAKRRLKHLESLRFRRERGPELPLFTDGRLNLYGFNRIFSAITQLLSTAKDFSLDLSQSCFYYSAIGAKLINQVNVGEKQAKPEGGQFEYCVDLNGEHIFHWGWLYRGECGDPVERHWAKHVVTTLGDQIIDFQSPVFLNYRANDKGYWHNGSLVNGYSSPVIVPVMYDRNIIRRFKDWAVPRNGLTVSAAWKPTNHQLYWMRPDCYGDIDRFIDRVFDLFEQRVVCRELEQFHGLDKLDYTDTESYIWANGQ